MFKWLVIVLNIMLSICVVEEEPIYLEVSPISHTLFYEVEETELTRYATTSLNIRSLPRVDSDSIGVYSSGAEVQVIGVCDNGWYQVSNPAGVGFVNSAYTVETYITWMTIEGEVPYTFIEEVGYYWNLIPENLRYAFVTDGCELIITTEHIGTNIFGDSSLSCLAATQYYMSSSNCKIYIAYNESAKDAICHEIGHYLDWELGDICETKEFQAIWGSEWTAMAAVNSTNISNINTAHEYFAEACSEYILHNDRLKIYCPETYSYIEVCLQSR